MGGGQGGGCVRDLRQCKYSCEAKVKQQEAREVHGWGDDERSVRRSVSLMGDQKDVLRFLESSFSDESQVGRSQNLS